VVGAVLIPGASAPKLVRREMIANMKRGAVVVDVAIDQGGCFETSHATTHTEPIYFRGWRAALLRLQHARRGAAHFHFRADQRHFPLSAGTGEQGPGSAPASARGMREGVNTYNGYVTHAPAWRNRKGRQWRDVRGVV
jgi:alanine dehydrogenase